jgi:hypothetical protein
MRYWMGRVVIILAALAVCAAGLGCDAVKLLLGQKRGGASSESGAYFKDASSVPGKLKAKITGPVRLFAVEVYPDFVEAKIQDPKRKEHVDAYELRDGRVGDPVPVKFMINIPTAKDLDGATFDLATVDFAAVPKMTKDAPAQLKMEGGHVTNMILKRDLPFSQDVRWRVYVSGARGDGSVEYDAGGHMKKVWR